MARARAFRFGVFGENARSPKALLETARRAEESGYSTWHPVMLANEIATLDVLSNGRVELGLGAGFSKAEYDGAGIPFDPPGARVDRLEESIHVLKGLFGDGPLTFAGKHYAVTGLDTFPKPVQRAAPPSAAPDRGRGQAHALDRGARSRHHRLSNRVHGERRDVERSERPPGPGGRSEGRAGSSDRGRAVQPDRAEHGGNGRVRRPAAPGGRTVRA